MRVVAILQARMGSTRLPGKIILPLAGKLLMDNVYERVKRATKLDRVILALPKKDYNAVRFTQAQSRIPFDDFFLFDGDEHDLIARYLACAIRHQADLIVRVPCDNAAVDPVYIDRAIEDYLGMPKVFLSNTTDYIKDYGWVDGVGAEVFSISRLKWLDRVTQGNAMEREHPHKFFYDYRANHPEDNDGIDRNLVEPAHRLDVNTMEDYLFIKDIYDFFSHNHFTTAEVLEYLSGKEVVI